MKHWTLTTFLLCGLAAHAQTAGPDAPAAPGSPGGPVSAIQRAVATVDTVNEQAAAREEALFGPDEASVSLVEAPDDPGGFGSAEELPDAALDSDTVPWTGLVGETGEGDPMAAETMESVLALDEVVTEEAVPSVDADEVVLDYGDSDSSSQLTRADDTISVDFPNEDVRTIIRNVADLYELNVVVPEALVGSVSLKLRGVTWRQVFDVVLEPLNYTWVEDGNIIKIRSLDELMKEPVSTRVFVINFATASEIQSSISPLVDNAAGGRIQVDVRSNALVITERPSRMNGIQAIIERLDRPTEQVMIESKFVEVTRRDEKNLGINWSALNGYELSISDVSREYLSESGSSYTNNRERARGYDGPAPIDTNITESLFEGVNNTTKMDTAVFSASSFNMILSALENNNEVELVSNPTVVTMNNTVAQINIGEEFPIPAYNYNQERGTFEVSGFDYKPIGILLNVTPQVNSAGFINLAIAPEISSRTGEVEFGGAGGASIPIITTRKTESTVTIKSGYTLAIGGLMERRTGVTENKVPVLGDIPIMGRLFKSNSDTLDARNLIIFITAKVLNPDGSTYEDVFSTRTLNEMGISRRDVPGYEPSESETALYERLQTERDALESMKTQTELQQQLMLIEELRRKADEAEEKRAEKAAGF